MSLTVECTDCGQTSAKPEVNRYCVRKQCSKYFAKIQSCQHCGYKYYTYHEKCERCETEDSSEFSKDSSEFSKESSDLSSDSFENYKIMGTVVPTKTRTIGDIARAITRKAINDSKNGAGAVPSTFMQSHGWSLY